MVLTGMEMRRRTFSSSSELTATWTSHRHRRDCAHSSLLIREPHLENHPWQRHRAKMRMGHWIHGQEEAARRSHQIQTYQPGGDCGRRDLRYSLLLRHARPTRKPDCRHHLLVKPNQTAHSSRAHCTLDSLRLSTCRSRLRRYVSVDASQVPLA